MNPMTSIRGMALMLELMHLKEAADSIYKAVNENLDEGRLLMPDLQRRRKRW